MLFEHLLQKIARTFEAAGLPYMVIGGQAVLIYGEPLLRRFERLLEKSR